MTEDGGQVTGDLPELDLSEGEELVLVRSGEGQAWLLEGLRSPVQRQLSRGGKLGEEVGSLSPCR